MFARKLLKPLSLLLFSASLCAALCAQVEAAPRYPKYSNMRGEAWLTGKDGKRTPLRGQITLAEKALFETGKASSLKVELDANRSFIMYANSSVLLPTISWESGEAPVVTLKEGSIRWLQKGEKPAYNIALNSDLFQFIAPPGEFLFTMDPEHAFAGVKVFEGIIEFSALNGEDSVTVKKGQEVGFQGIIEGKEIAYDVLLKGKKIPRGQLTAVKPIDKSDLTEFDAAEEKREKAEAQRRKKEASEAQASVAKGFICTKPAGRFNDCAWECRGNPKSEKKACLMNHENVSCVRRRCNANGDWAEEAVLDAQEGGNKCQVKAVVSPCDY